MKTPARFLFVLVICLTFVKINAAQGPPAKLIITNANLMTMATGQETPFVGYIVVGTDETIIAIGAGSLPAGLTAATTFDAAGKWIIPGFISAHSHIWQSAYRGLAQNQELDGWLTALYIDHAPKADA